MVNGLAVLGWGVGGIEAEAAMLGQPISMLIPEVIGFRLTGKLREGVTATDLVLTVTQMLRKKGVVGKFVEFYGPGLDHLALEDRATIGNMAPEYGATCGFFPIDAETLRYLAHTGRDDGAGRAGRGLCQGAGHVPRRRRRPIRCSPTRSRSTSTRSCPRSPARSARRTGVLLSEAKQKFLAALDSRVQEGRTATACRVSVKGEPLRRRPRRRGDRGDHLLHQHLEPLACMIGAGLLARNAVERGLKTKPWVKTSLAPGSQVVGDYLASAGLQGDLDALGFNLVGFGCTTCIGNSGPLPDADLRRRSTRATWSPPRCSPATATSRAASIPDVRANYLASPPLVVAYALAGSMQVDLTTEPLGIDRTASRSILKDIWPTSKEIAEFVRANITSDLFRTRYADVFKGDEHWKKIPVEGGLTYRLDRRLDLCAEPALFRGHAARAGAGHRHRRRARPRPLPRFDHHRPHLAGRLDQAPTARPAPT